jgi:hypothetical protein
VHLFKPTTAMRGRDNGVAITYYLKAPAMSVGIEVLDGTGKPVRTWTITSEGQRAAGARAAGAGAAGGGGGRRGGGGGAPTARVGTNRMTWDMRYPGPTTFDGMILWAAGSNGPIAVPGTYQVRLTVDAHPPQTQSFEIGKASRLAHVSVEDMRAQFDLAVRVRDRTSEANEAVIAMRDIKTQVDDRVGRDGSIRQEGDQLKTKFTDVEGEIYQYRNQSNQDPLNYPIKLNNKLAALQGAVEGVHGAPTAQTYVVFEELSGRLDVQLEALNQIIITDLAEFNRLLQSKGLEPIPDPRARPVT